MTRQQLDSLRRILILRLSARGDVLHCTPVAEALRRAFPAAHIAWVVDDHCVPIVEGNPFIDEVIPRKRRREVGTAGQLADLVRMGRKLRQMGFDAAFDLHGLFKSAFLGYLSGARLRVGFANGREGSPLFYNVKVSPLNNVYITDHYLAVVAAATGHNTSYPIYLAARQEDEDAANALCSELGMGEEPYAAICPATTWPHKHWTNDGFAQVCDWIEQHLGLTPLFLGAQQDRERIEAIQGKMHGQSASALGRTSLRQAMALVEGAALVVGVDTFLSHVGVAAEVPSVLIFGPTGGPLIPRGPRATGVRRDCAQERCGRHTRCNYYECMELLAPQEVEEAIARVYRPSAAEARA